MARTRQPLESLKLKGQYRADRHCGIVGDGIAPEPPDDLTPEARAEWARIIPGLERLGVLSSVDRGGLVMLCEAWSSFVALSSRVAAMLDAGQLGVELSRLNSMKNAARTAYLKLAKQFRMTPAARLGSRVSRRSEEADDDEAVMKAICGF